MEDTQETPETQALMDQEELTPSITVPSGLELLKERLKTGISYQAQAMKYGCTDKNILQKIQRVIKSFSVDQHEAYLKDNMNYLKAIEALHIIESSNPTKYKKMNAMQHAITGKIIHQMIQEKEQANASTHGLNALIAAATTVNIYVNQPNNESKTIPAEISAVDDET